MFNEFMSMEGLTSFGGLTTAVIVIVQFTKPLLKRRFGDYIVRPYSFLISLILILCFSKEDLSIRGIIIMIINSMMVTITSMGGYEMIADPMARKTRR